MIYIFEQNDDFLKYIIYYLFIYFIRIMIWKVIIKLDPKLIAWQGRQS